MWMIADDEGSASNWPTSPPPLIRPQKILGEELTYDRIQFQTPEAAKSWPGSPPVGTEEDEGERVSPGVLRNE